MPMLIAHADWSLHPAKRWLAVATRTADGWTADAPIPVGDLATLLARLRERAGDGPVVLGIDTPLGLPAAYTEAVGIASFSAFLTDDLGKGAWADFAAVARAPGEIGLRRPFYPYAPGGTRLRHLTDALGVVSARDLRRACELASAKLPGILFWTLGANQTGKAALRAWAELVGPALEDPTVRLWPFHGDLPALVAAGGTVIVETYPAAAAEMLGIPIFRKTSQAARQAAAPDIERVCGELGISPSVELEAVVCDGFGPEKAGEDPFDALIGLLGMVAVVAGGRPTGIGEEGESAAVRTVEGWILGVRAAGESRIPREGVSDRGCRRSSGRR